MKGTIDQALVQVQVNAGLKGFQPGVYDGNVEIISDAGGSKKVHVVAQVGAHPRAGISLNSLLFPDTINQRTFYLHNTGTGLLKWTRTTNQTWLSVLPTSGIIASGDSALVSATIDRSSLLAGTYSAMLQIASNSEDGTITIPVNIDVIARAKLSLSVQSLLFDYFVDSSRVVLRNTGNAPCNWIASISDTILTADRSSGSLANGDSLTLNFRIHRSTLSTGTYITTVTFSIGGAQIVTLSATTKHFKETKWLLNRTISDAEFDRKNNLIITVSDNPSALDILDPETKSAQAIVLIKTPQCVSVGQDGMHAAVGHDALVSYVNLSTRTVEKTIAVSAAALDIVLAMNGWVYVFPTRDQWTQIRCIQLSSGQETLHTGSPIYAGTLARLHPSGNYIYGANNGLSPSDFEKYDIRNGTATYLYDSPYHGDYSFGGDVWVSDDGTRLFARSGNTFRSSALKSEDMTYMGALSGVTSLLWLEHSSTANRIFAVQSNSSSIRVYDASNLSYKGSITLPSFLVPDGVGGGRIFPGLGRYAFANSVGSRLFVVLQAAAGSGLAFDYAIVSFDMSSLP
jgi:hypothetical protein